MKEYKNPICIRGAHLNCPLPLALESYWACEADCYHCLGRKMNKIWGSEQRASSPEKVFEKLKSSQENKNPRTPLAVALKSKKAIWIGRKADPYQPIDIELEVTRRNIMSLIELDWPFVICSRYLANAKRDEDLFLKASDYFTFLLEITPGGEKDWEIFERKRTTSIRERLIIAKRWQEKGVKVGIRGEPFIPGYHTCEQFRDMLKRIHSYGFKSYNTYNLHLNDYTLKRLLSIGLDIEKIWEYNQDRQWQLIQHKLCQIAEEEDIILGCPDFVNTPKGWKSQTNTCCGVDALGAFKFNTHVWKRLLQAGETPEKILEDTWEGIGEEEDKKMAEVIMYEKNKNFFTMKDAGL